MELYFNNLPVPKVVSFSADRKTRGSRVNYNCNGDMLIDMVARKFTLTVVLGELTAEELGAVFKETEGVFFNVTFYAAAYGEVQRKFHLAEQPEQIDFNSGGKAYYKATRLVLEEL